MLGTILSLATLSLAVSVYAAAIENPSLDEQPRTRPWNDTLDYSYIDSPESAYNSSTTKASLFDTSNLDELFFARSPTTSLDLRPTPAPTGDPSSLTTVHVTNQNDFSLLMPKDGELISDAENDGSAFCTPNSQGSHCSKRLPAGFIRAAAVEHDKNGAWVQVTGCLNSSKYPFARSDDGGQFDVRFPNGAQCTFGGYRASFIEQVEPTANRFCLRCCSSKNDQENCNSHQDQSGCLVAVPGQYDFPELGVHCS